jgi:hypothetical protein
MTNPAGFEHGHDSIPLRHADDELVVDVPAVWRFNRQYDFARRQGAGAFVACVTPDSQTGWRVGGQPCFGEQALVGRRIPLPTCRPVIQIF